MNSIRLAGRMWLSLRRWRLQIVLWSGALLVGAVACLTTLGSDAAQAWFTRQLTAHPWAPWLLSPAAVALCVWLTRNWFVGAQGSGIPQAMAALQIDDAGERRRLLSLRIAIGKMGMLFIGLAGGAAIGREGPTVQIGASLMAALGRFFPGNHTHLRRSLILAGGAAGVAAAFNTPLAGVVFAIEEMGRSFEERTSGVVITAVIMAGISSLAILGNYTYFGHASVGLDSSDWLAVLICGAVGGLMGGVFSRLLLEAGRPLPGAVGRWRDGHPYQFAAACGLSLAVIGWASHGSTWGIGYTQARHLLETGQQLPAGFGTLKLLAVLIAQVSGMPGGIFSPSLAVGAGFGAELAWLAPHVPLAAMVLLGMGAYFAGVVQAPITAFVIVMEMTDDHQLVMPLMAAALIGAGVSRLVCRKPVYKALAERFYDAAKQRLAGQATPALLTASAEPPSPTEPVSPAE